ncbi:MAG: hypothetical protein WCT44_03050 [Candidatus Paceibacterota bacterium]
MAKIRNIIIFVIILAAIFLGYLYFIKPPGDEANLVSSSSSSKLPNIDGSVDNNTKTDGQTSLVAKDFLALLLNVRNIKLDDSVLSDPAFLNLQDSSIILTQDGTEGRPNPFAQFGNDTVSTAPVTPQDNLDLSDIDGIIDGTSTTLPDLSAEPDTTTKTPAKTDPSKTSKAQTSTTP